MLHRSYHTKYNPPSFCDIIISIVVPNFSNYFHFTKTCPRRSLPLTTPTLLKTFLLPRPRGWSTTTHKRRKKKERKRKNQPDNYFLQPRRSSRFFDWHHPTTGSGGGIDADGKVRMNLTACARARAPLP